MDGVGETYAKVRGLDSFDRVMRTFKELRELKAQFPNLRPHICYTMSRFNAGEFQAFYDNVRRDHCVSIDEISFTFEHFVGFYFRELPTVQPNSAEFSKLLLKDLAAIQRIREKSGSTSRFALKDMFYDYYLNHIPRFLADPHRQVLPCSAGRLSAFVDPYGNVQPCSMWNKVIGNLKSSSFREIWTSPEKIAVRKEVIKEACPNCWTPCEAQPTWIGNLPRALIP